MNEIAIDQWGEDPERRIKGFRIVARLEAGAVLLFLQRWWEYGHESGRAEWREVDVCTGECGGPETLAGCVKFSLQSDPERVARECQQQAASIRKRFEQTLGSLEAARAQRIREQAMSREKVDGIREALKHLTVGNGANHE